MTPAPRTQPKSRRAARKDLPRDADVIRRYNFELTISAWGAETRTAEFCKCSHTHVGNVLIRAGIKQKRKPKLPEPAPVVVPDYEPLDAQFEIERDRANAEFATNNLLSGLLSENLATPEVDVTEPVNVEPPLRIATQDEIETVRVYVARPQPLVVSNDTTTPADDQFTTYFLMAAMIVAFVLTMVGLKSGVLWFAIAMPVVAVGGVAALFWACWYYIWDGRGCRKLSGPMGELIE